MADQPSSLAEHAAIPWVERYRPKELKDVSHQGEIVATLKNAVETNRLPHLLFYGPPGTGVIMIIYAFVLSNICIHYSQSFVVYLQFVFRKNISSPGSMPTALRSKSTPTPCPRTKCLRRTRHQCSARQNQTFCQSCHRFECFFKI